MAGVGEILPDVGGRWGSRVPPGRSSGRALRGRPAHARGGVVY